MTTRRPVYRKAALDKLSSPEELDQLMQITRPGSWLLLAAWGGVLLMVVLWGIFGQVTIAVEHSGTFTLSNPIVFIVAPESGQIDRLTVNPGDVIRPGQIVAFITTREGETHVTTNVNGRVLSLRIGIGDPVDAGTPLLSVESFDREMQHQAVVVYVPLEDRQQIRAGMDAQILPSTVEREKYGYLEGHVQSVAQFASTREEMLIVLGDASFVNDLTTSGPMFEVRITLDTDDDGNYVWSASDGPPFRIVSGTHGSVTVIVDEERPISRLFKLSS